MIRSCSSWDNGEFVDGAIVKDSSYGELHNYEDEGEDAPGPSQEIVNLLRNLDAEPGVSYWSGEFATGSYEEEAYTIDLHNAAAWTPAGEP